MKTKIQCNACDAVEANVLCCADEAVLCWICDEKIHAAKKLSGMHQRVPLSSSSSRMPKCDIFQADNGELGESEWLRIILATEDKMHNSERSGNASDACWTEPDILSPPTASSLHLPKQMDKTIFNTALFIPDIGFSGDADLHQQQLNPISTKRQRQGR
ncbi:hypothetical protein F0562_008035 [Nyssa sinensis]|uniref:B box-type domain-containing protein n=1 Tax=Nyssa sinensis TaxID=561372 RepID=A0A5J5A8V5_9ASTE|nr:hypothetical protein F0562_008035 [Nyssa sinensis]